MAKLVNGDYLKILDFLQIEYDENYFITRVPLKLSKNFKALNGCDVNNIPFGEDANILLDIIDIIEDKYTSLFKIEGKNVSVENYDDLESETGITSIINIDGLSKIRAMLDAIIEYVKYHV